MGGSIPRVGPTTAEVDRLRAELAETNQTVGRIRNTLSVVSSDVANCRAEATRSDAQAADTGGRLKACRAALDPRNDGFAAARMILLRPTPDAFSIVDRGAAWAYDTQDRSVVLRSVIPTPSPFTLRMRIDGMDPMGTFRMAAFYVPPGAIDLAPLGYVCTDPEDGTSIRIAPGGSGVNYRWTMALVDPSDNTLTVWQAAADTWPTHAIVRRADKLYLQAAADVQTVTVWTSLVQ